MDNLEDSIEKVLAIDSSKSRSDIILDLKHTNSVEATVNRIFDGHFLNGTERDPSNAAVLIIDSDDDIDEELVHRRPLAMSNSKSISLQDNYEASSFDTLSPRSTRYNEETVKKQMQSEDLLHEAIKTTPPAAEASNQFSIMKDDVQDDDSIALPSSPPSFLSLEDDVGITSITQEEKLSNVFGIHFDDEDDAIDELPSASDFFDDLLIQKPVTPVVKLDDDKDDDDDDDDDAIEIISPISNDRKGKRRAYDYDAPLEPTRSQRRRLDDDIPNLHLPMTAAERKEKEKEEKKRKRQQAAEEKKRKKIEALQEKKKQKEEKQLEKERKTLFEKENRIRADRNEILKEIIVDIHPDFLKTKPGQLLELVLTKKQAEIQDLTMRNPNPLYTLSWRRKTNSEWDQDSQTFIPIFNTKIVQEPVVLVYVDIPQFIQRIQNKTVDRYIDVIERDCDGRQIMLLIEGLEVYYKKKMLLKRRQFETQVRNSFDAEAGSSTSATSSKRKNALASLEDGLESSDVEECLNYLQIMRGVMLVPTKDDEDTASWIESLTTDLALGRYKTKNINNAYKVGRSGTDAKDTYLKMLQEIQLCTSAIANSVANSYPSLQALHRSYQRRNVADAELMLADLEVERSAPSSRDRKINRVMSKKIYTIFNSDDPEQIIY
ncbi:hypothetical protein [Parasitella parasitica]|uniref:ERCC4 domain-containing protein n=1 Tax=Parasitella parasitica TaxID=35722 RepID=A0A0B7NI82_9FUNG|nr:hypothetical protein [Parasitella parasitica]